MCRYAKVTEQQISEKPDQTWPVVRVHPVTGAKSLYVNPKNTRAVVDLRTGAEVADGLALVQSLGAAVVGEEGGEGGEGDEEGSSSSYLVYKHRWERGDFVIWDNRVLLHAASPFDAERFQRLLFRMEFKGEPVIGTPLLD